MKASLPVAAAPTPKAPVYRNLEAPNRLLGLPFPNAWAGVLAAGWVGTALGAPNLGALAACGIYLFLRVAGRTRPEGYLRDLFVWKERQVRTGGVASAAARARTPRFPLAGAEGRDPGRVARR